MAAFWPNLSSDVDHGADRLVDCLADRRTNLHTDCSRKGLKKDVVCRLAARSCGPKAVKLLERFEYRDESKTSVDSKGIDGVYSGTFYSRVFNRMVTHQHC